MWIAWGRRPRVRSRGRRNWEAGLEPGQGGWEGNGDEKPVERLLCSRCGVAGAVLQEQQQCVLAVAVAALTGQLRPYLFEPKLMRRARGGVRIPTRP